MAHPLLGQEIRPTLSCLSSRLLVVPLSPLLPPLSLPYSSHNLVMKRVVHIHFNKLLSRV